MEDGASSTGGEGIPEGWVRYNPDEPIYERLHLCVYLSELADLSEGGRAPGPCGEEGIPALSVESPGTYSENICAEKL